jgi:hypothetical protein
MSSGFRPRPSIREGFGVAACPMTPDFASLPGGFRRCQAFYDSM